MKKLLVLFTVLMLGIMCCYAYSFPRWRSMPIRVYIPEYGDYTKLMIRAFNDWQRITNNVVCFKRVNKQSESDIYVGFVDYVSTCKDGNAVGCTVYSYRNGFFTQNYIEIGTKESRMSYNKAGKVTKNEDQRSAEHIYGVMLHEIGHALGLKHNEDPDSIMYAYDLDDYQELTDVDVKLILNKYR